MISIGFILLWTCLLTGQGSFAQDISDSKSISDDRLTQIEALNKILIKRKYTSFPDSLGLVNYAIAFRYRILGDDINVIKSAEAGIVQFQEAGYQGYQLPFLYSFLGESYTAIGELDPALSNYQKILDITPEGRAITVYGYAAFKASDLLRNVEDYRSALDFIEYATKGKYANQISPFDLVNLYLSESICHSNLDVKESIQQAHTSLQQAIDIASSLPDLPSLKYIELDNQQAYLLLKRNEQQKAANLYQKSIAEIEKLQKEDNSFSIDAAIAANNISFIYQEAKDYNNALLYAQKANSFMENIEDLAFIETEFLNYNNLATTYLGLNQLDKASLHIEKALSLFPTTTRANSDYKKLILEGLFDQARITAAHGDRAHKQEALDIIIELDDLFDSHVDDQLSSYSVQNLKSKGSEYFKYGIDLAYDLKDVDAYWHLSEKMKGLQLLEANLSNQSANNTPSEITLNDIKRDILRLNYLVERTEKKGTIDSLNQLLSAAKKNRITLNQQIKSESQKSNLSIINLEDLQSSLDNKTIIQFQSGSDYIYGLHITNDQLNLTRLSTIDDLNRKLKQLRTLIEDPDSDITKLNKLANELYHILIAPFDLSAVPLNIILDEELYGVPFDILQDNDGSYLFSKRAISLSISGSFDAAKNKASSINKTKSVRAINVVRPNYKKSSELPTLPFAIKEEEFIELSYNVSTIGEGNISKSRFDSLLASSAVMHYSGHAIANNGIGENAYLALSGSSDISNRLLLGELYTLNTTAQMVVLSACNTGTGQIIKGEGVESLARGFLYAGAQSVINTLWTVDDNSTATIMGSFYTQLKKQENKSEALRNAKLKYLASADAFQRHPYYWAGIVAVGDMSPIKEYSINWTKHALLLVVFLVLAWFLTWRHSKKPFPKIEFLSDQF